MRASGVVAVDPCRDQDIKQGACQPPEASATPGRRRCAALASRRDDEIGSMSSPGDGALWVVPLAWRAGLW